MYESAEWPCTVGTCDSLSLLRFYFSFFLSLHCSMFLFTSRFHGSSYFTDNRTNFKVRLHVWAISLMRTSNENETMFVLFVLRVLWDKKNSLSKLVLFRTVTRFPCIFEASNNMKLSDSLFMFMSANPHWNEYIYNALNASWEIFNIFELKWLNPKAQHNNMESIENNTFLSLVCGKFWRQSFFFCGATM